MADLEKIPFCPAQASFGASFGDGSASTALDGGASRYRAGPDNQSDTVDVSWVLRAENYSMFMGFFRKMRRLGGGPFLIDLSLQSHEMVEYTAYFVPRTLHLVSRQGAVYTVSAQLEVLSRDDFDQEDLDYWGRLVTLLIIYGNLPAAKEILDLLAKLVNEDLPHD